MSVNRLSTAEREQAILSRLRESQVVSVPELEGLLGVSPATTRRDLQSLHERGLLRRIRGGATLGDRFRVEPVFRDKESQNAEAKRAIARTALELVEDYDRIYLDGGSTVLTLARLLGERRGLTVVTNSLEAATVLMAMPHRLIVVGGEFRALSRTLVGPLSACTIDRIHVDKAFMGTIGFTLPDGMSTTDPNEAFTKERVLPRANQIILLADSTKLGMPSFAGSGDAGDIDILVTETVTPQLRIELEETGIRLRLAGGPRSDASQEE